MDLNNLKDTEFVFENLKEAERELMKFYVISLLEVNTSTERFILNLNAYIHIFLACLLESHTVRQ